MGSTTPHPSAVLDVQATDKAFYPPRLTTIQRKAIVNPQSGAFVYDLDKSTFYLFDGVKWLPLAFTTDSNLPTTDRTASDGAAGDQFGFSVAISGDYALVGSPRNDVGANINQGAVYVFVRSGSTWTQQTKLTVFGGSAGDQFGFSVAISGNSLLIGSPYDDVGSNIDQGSAYVFVRSGSVWSQLPVLTASDGAGNDAFGESVAISSNDALVGSNRAIGYRGAAYVFVRPGSTWIQQAKLIAGDGAVNDRFGGSVAISGNYALVGCYGDDVGSNADQGSAYVFVRSGSSWPQQAKLIANDGAANDRFGVSVAISGDYALISSPYDNIGDVSGDQGSAYVFVRIGGGWSQQTKLIANDPANYDNFGITVAISGDYALVGSPYHDVGGNKDQGSAYLYKREGTSWLFVRQITDNSPANTRNSASGISNGTFIIGGGGVQNFQGKVGFGTVDN